MNTEEFAQLETKTEGLKFDAHEFDGLRDEFAGVAETWLKRADEFVRKNPWLCIALAAGIGCGAAMVMRRSGEDDASDDDAAES